jgi:hypothetical protein
MRLGGRFYYAYFLALAHVIFGEDLFGIFLIQVLLVWVTLLAIWKISGRLFGEKVGAVSLVVAAIFLYVSVLPMARVLLWENLFISLLSLCVLSMIGMTARRRAWKSSCVAARVLAIVVAAVSLDIVRQFDGFFPVDLNHALYALGFFGSLVTCEDNRPALIAMCSASLVGLWLLVWPGVGKGLRGPVRLFPAALSLVYLLYVIVFFPHNYSDRLLLPLYVILLPYVAVTVAYAADIVSA